MNPQRKAAIGSRRGLGLQPGEVKEAGGGASIKVTNEAKSSANQSTSNTQVLGFKKKRHSLASFIFFFLMYQRTMWNLNGFHRIVVQDFRMLIIPSQQSWKGNAHVVCTHGVH